MPIECRQSQIDRMYNPILEYKFINCMAYNKRHPTNLMDTAHYSLDKKCPSLKAVLDKYKRNTDY